MNNWEPGDSDGASKRIEMGCEGMAVLSFKICGIGLKDLEGIECESVGHRLVGGSYLQTDGV